MVNRRPRGLTLLELILSLSLTVVVLGLVSVAIDLHLRMLDNRRDVVEQSQLANALLNRIADDLRNTIQYSSVDFSSVEQMMTGVSGEAMEGLSEAAGGAGVDMSDIESMGETTDNTTDIASSAVPPLKPGLYGNQYELLIDVSRLPRLDEYQRVLQADLSRTLQDIPSDVKTIAYYVKTDATPFGGSAAVRSPIFPEDTMGSVGLVRRQLDRAITSYASENSNLQSLQQVGDVIAPEVTGIEFRYFDGLEWLTEWDSDLNGGLPLAVEIVLAISELPTDENPGLLPGSFSTATVNPPSFYRLVVRLPVAQPIEEEESSELEALGL